MNEHSLDRAIASAALKNINVTVAIGSLDNKRMVVASDFVRHTYCRECLDRPYLAALYQAGRLIDANTSNLQCETCGAYYA